MRHAFIYYCFCTTVAAFTAQVPHMQRKSISYVSFYCYVRCPDMHAWLVCLRDVYIRPRSWHKAVTGCVQHNYTNFFTQSIRIQLHWRKVCNSFWHEQHLFCDCGTGNGIFIILCWVFKTFSFVFTQNASLMLLTPTFVGEKKTLRRCNRHKRAVRSPFTKCCYNLLMKW